MTDTKPTPVAEKMAGNIVVYTTSSERDGETFQDIQDGVLAIITEETAAELDQLRDRVKRNGDSYHRLFNEACQFKAERDRLKAINKYLVGEMELVSQHAYDEDTPEHRILEDFDNMRQIALDAIAKATETKEG